MILKNGASQRSFMWGLDQSKISKGQEVHVRYPPIEAARYKSPFLSALELDAFRWALQEDLKTQINHRTPPPRTGVWGQVTTYGTCSKKQRLERLPLGVKNSTVECQHTKRV